MFSPEAMTPRFMVIQTGARLGYAVPTFLAQAGALDSLYTDICSSQSLDRLFSLWPKSLKPEALTRLLGRRLPADIPRHRTRSIPARAMLARLLHRDLEAQINRRVLRDGFGSADALYTSSLHLPLVLAARKRGMFVAYEQLNSPDDIPIMREERRRFPGVEADDWASGEAFDIGCEPAIWAAADLILAPSAFVQSSLATLGASPDRIALVPYGIPATWLDLVPTPRPGRVLFVGQAGLRKGTHYLAAATRILKARGILCDVRVVGMNTRTVLTSSLFHGPAYLGHMPRTEVYREFLEADIFVLPTLSDACSVAHLEALACGVPVITTPNCGSVVRDGVEGFIVPVREEVALADKIELLVTDRVLRDRMSQNARARARQYTWKEYKLTLLAALGIMSVPGGVGCYCPAC